MCIRDRVYVTGFGWVEYEGPNRCEDSTDIYENGNKIEMCIRDSH